MNSRVMNSRVMNVRVGRLRARIEGDERGAGTMLTATAAGVLVLAGLVLALTLAVVVQGQQARAAADLGALAGASAHTTGQDACEAAAATVSANGAELVSCELAGDQVEFALTITVRLPLPSPLPPLQATAVAGRVS